MLVGLVRSCKHMLQEVERNADHTTVSLTSRPIMPADEVDNVKPMLGMKKRHEETKDATNGRSRAVWGK